MSLLSELTADSALFVWKLGEASTASAVADSSSNGRNGSYTGTGLTLGRTGLVATASSETAMLGAASGSSGAAAIGYSSWMNQSALSIFGVMKGTAASVGVYICRDAQSTTRVWQLQRNASGKLVFTVLSGAIPSATSVASVNDGSIHDFEVTYDGTTCKIYIDGALDNTVTLSQAIGQPTVTGITVGNSGRTISSGFAADMQYVSVMPQVNNSTRVTAHHFARLHDAWTSTATPALTIATAAATALGLKGAATETLTVTPASTGVRGKVATAAATLAIAATAAGVVTHGPSGNAGRILTVSGTAAANLGIHASSTRALTLTPTAAGAHGKAGAVAATIAIGGTADGAVSSAPRTHLAWDGGLGIAFSSGGGDFEPAYVAPPVPLATRVIVAQAIDSVAQDGVQFTPSVRTAEDGYLAHRIVVGGKDVTYFRGVQTPLPTYGLVSPLRYGSGQITFPQIHAAYERPGHGDISWLKKFAVVRVQRVNTDGTIAATDYKGFISDFGHQGRTMTCTLGGEVTGLAAMVDRPVPIFPDIRDVGTMVQQTIRGSLRVPTANMPTTGINLLNFGGMSALDFLTEALAKSTEKDGDQWTVMPNTAGRYRMFQKDTTTVRASVYIDGFRVSEDLRRDFTEEPNRVFAQGIGPDGLRNRFAVYPGLAQAGDITFPGTLSPGDSGDEVTQLMWRLYTMGYIDGKPGFETWTTASDDPVTEAVKDLQDDAGLAQTGVVNAATWRALFNPDVTGYSLIHSRIVPAAQRSYTKYFLTDATGNVIGPNPNADRSRPWVDVTVDMGPGFTRRQIKKWARKELADDTLSNWVGTVTVNMGGVIDGTHNPGDPLTSADVLDARAIKPGDNLWLPNWDGGTLVHVSGVNVSASSVEFTVDTRARDTMKVWQVIARNRQSRMNPSRQWIAQNRRSHLRDDTSAFYDGATFGKIPRTFCRANAWTVVPTPAGRSGILQTVDIQTTDSQARFGLWVSGKQFDDLSTWLDAHVGDPFDIDGVTFGVPYSEHVQRNTKTWTDAKGLIDIWGDENQPCGYWPRQHTNSAGTVTDAPITGQFRFTAGTPYLCQRAPVLWIAVRPDRNCWVEGGRVLELLLDDAAG